MWAFLHSGRPLKLCKNALDGLCNIAQSAAMSILLTPEQIEAKAAACGKSMAEVCREAAIAPSTFSRWRRGETEPTLGVYRRLCEAVGVAVSEPVATPAARADAA
jgi:hypothetical protein